MTINFIESQKVIHRFPNLSRVQSPKFSRMVSFRNYGELEILFAVPDFPREELFQYFAVRYDGIVEDVQEWICQDRIDVPAVLPTPSGRVLSDSELLSLGIL